MAVQGCDEAAVKPRAANSVALSGPTSDRGTTELKEKTFGKAALQVAVAGLAATPVLVGLEGMVSGPQFLHVTAPWPVDLDSHFRFLSGFFLAVGIAWYSCIPGIETKTERFRLLAACTFSGGLARLFSLLVAGAPSAGHIAGLCVELLAMPALVWWQGRVANNAAENVLASGL